MNTLPKILDARYYIPGIDDYHTLLKLAASDPQQMRIAINVGFRIEEASELLVSGGAVQVTAVRKAPRRRVARLKSPDGMQLKLFETSALFPE